MPTNQAAWLVATRTPLQVKTAPYTSPGEDQIVIRNGAVAINPVDFIQQLIGSVMFPWVKLPFIIGTDVAGEVVEVGKNVTRFKVGDRVTGSAAAIDKQYNSSAMGAFQKYTVMLPHMSAFIPQDMSYERAAVMPLGLSTAACGLFQKDQLGLQYPSTAPKPTGKTLIVWGGSTSVGCNAIQLAVAAGYKVISTSSPKNFELVKSLGADQVFDYKSNSVVSDMIDALKDDTLAGALSIGAGAADACIDILHKCKGTKFIAMATYPLPEQPPERFFMIRSAYAFLTWSIVAWFKSNLRGISKNFIFGGTLIHNGVGKAMYNDFLPQALAQGRFVPAPEPQVVGKGLENIQEGFDILKRGVSAKKVVVKL